MLSRSFNQSGYVLVDVLVAVTILSIGLVFVASSMMVPLRAVNSSLNHSNALWLIDQTLSELRRDLVSLPSKTVHEIDGKRFVCKVEGSGYEGRLHWVRIEVTWEERREIKKAHLETVVYTQRN